MPPPEKPSEWICSHASETTFFGLKTSFFRDYNTPALPCGKYFPTAKMLFYRLFSHFFADLRGDGADDGDLSDRVASRPKRQ